MFWDTLKMIEFNAKLWSKVIFGISIFLFLPSDKKRHKLSFQPDQDVRPRDPATSLGWNLDDESKNLVIGYIRILLDSGESMLVGEYASVKWCF